MNRAMRLAIELATSAKTAGMDALTASAKKAGDAVKGTSSALKLSSDATDAAASKASTATGAFGALGSGLELVGAGGSGAAAALMSAGLATDFLSGVTDFATLALESERVKTIAVTVAKRTGAAVTRGMAAAQWALNAAMNANPIGLIILAVVALVAGFILLWKRSDAFRTLVTSVGRAGQSAIGWIVDKVSALVSWVRDKVGPAFDKAKTAMGAVGDFLKNTVGPAFDAITTPLQLEIELVKSLIGWIKKIKLPDLGKLGDLVGKANPFDRGIVGRTATGGTSSSGPTTVVNNTITINGVLNAADAARQIEQLLNDRGRQLGYGAA